MPKLKPHTIVPTSQEDAQINRAITKDPDTSDLTKSSFLKRVGRPRIASPKIQLTVRYDADIVEAFKAQGPGWQTRMNEALREWLKQQA
jgi:uncharacterized protein (DUF4415 family)